jgi:RsiW-degrading membrane proteinase PrsW (M82 family)
MFYSILIAGAVPLLFLYFIKWLNFFETHRARLIFLALAWGVAASWLSYLVDHPLIAIFGRQTISTHVAPVVEEIFKSLVLLYLVRRSDHTYFVDGAIYGFAAGIGFAVSENMLYLSRVDVNTGLIVAIARAFSASVMHGGSTALVGIAIGGFPLARAVHPLVALLIGWTIASAYHMAYNHVTFVHWGEYGLFVISAAGFAGVVLVAIAILWGLRRERRRLRKALGMKTGVSRGEAKLVQRLDDLDDLLAPVTQRFGEAKREAVAAVLLLTAQLAMKQQQIRKTRDPELRTELAAEITTMKRDLKRQRGEVGMYVMSYVRSIVPRATWSVWARVGQALMRPRPGGASVWARAGGAGAPAAAGAGIYAGLDKALSTRASEQADDELPAALQQVLRWAQE